MRDSLSDVDGGIGVLFTYSSKGRRELPNSKVYVDGPVEPLSKDGSFLGQHVYTRLPGVAVQINAFNFPMWGALEKFAPAFLAGVPSLVKPATPTGYVAEAWVRILVESGLLPEGALQLVSGSVPTLFEHLDSATSSASPAAARRRSGCAHDSVQTGGVRFTSETDSINASVLGPDVAPGSPGFDAYVKQLLVELTTKAGQKCTAIRRAIVPEGPVDALVDALRAKIDERVVIGDPHAESVTMGPLVSLEQRDEVLRQVAALEAAGGRILLGSTDAPDVVRADGTVGPAAGRRVHGADPGRLRGCRDPRPSTTSRRSARCRASSRIRRSPRPPTSSGGAADRSSRASRPTIPTVAVELMTRMGAFNGRVLFLSSENARTSTGHGSPVPHLVHGGPGRAGGGEELGGIRAVLHHMQRTAIQGSPEMLTALTGVWHAGAAVQNGRHPFRKSLAELVLGDQVVSASREVTLDDIEVFARFTGDTFYAHMDEEAAAANPFFPGRVAHGYLLVSWAAGLFVDPEPGPVLANYGLENLRFITPVSPGDTIRVTLTAKQITPRETDEYGEVRWDAVILNQNDEIVATYDVLTLVAKESQPAWS